MEVRVHGEAEVRPTEDPEKVKKALTNVLPGEIEYREIDQWSGIVVVEGKNQASLERFRMILQRDRIRAAAKLVLRRSIEGNRITFFLNKQAAHAGHVSFSEPEGESPLGPIRVVLESEKPEQVVDWLAGRPEDRGRERS